MSNPLLPSAANRPKGGKIQMEKKICSYETLFTVSGNLAEDDAKAVVEKFVALINENASDVNVNEWGKRRLAYPINYVTEGYYVLVTYKSEPNFPAELDRVFGITEGIIRYMTTTKIEKAEKAEEAVVAPAETAEVAEATEE
jgi:small subunit ribosomal protein S6